MAQGTIRIEGHRVHFCATGDLPPRLGMPVIVPDTNSSPESTVIDAHII